jgi:coenzyme F420-reducing hydrogenase delta subunit
MSSKIVVFSCSWDGWSCIDAATNAGMPYPASVTVIKLPCLSGIDAGLILRALEYGADGVLLLGCKPHECRNGRYGENIEIEFDKARQLLTLLGENSDRVRLARLEAFDGTGFIETVRSFTSELKDMVKLKAAAGKKP